MSIFLNPFRILRKLRIGIENILSIFPVFYFFRVTRNYEYPITLKVWFKQKVLDNNASVYWPVHPSSLVSYQHRIIIGKGVSPGYQPGCFLHGHNGIYIGDYTYIAPNVGIMSANHDVYDLRNQTKGKPIKIGNYCWIGMNSVVLQNVILGDFTIVGAGSIVTKSFEEGYCVIGGNPAKILKKLDPDKCVKYNFDFKYIGYIPIEKFEEYKKRNLEIL